MTDHNPQKTGESTLKTKPADKVTIKESSLKASPIRTRPAQYSQVGMATSYLSNGENFSPTKKPHYYQLAAWDQARQKEPIIKNGIEKMVLYICSKLGSYHHKNPMIEDFISENIEGKLSNWVHNMAVPAFWSGFSVSENLFYPRRGPRGIRQIWIDDIVNYHPTQVDFRLNDYSRLTHGEKTSKGMLKSGIWVPAPANSVTNNNKKASSGDYTGGMVRLARHKVVHFTFPGSSQNNPWGESILTSVLDYHLFKEAFRDMMAVALDRYGTPLIYAIVPPQATSEMITDPDGTVRQKQYRESVAEALANAKGNQGIVLEQLSKEYPVDIGTLTTGNNFADAFNQAIDFCDNNMQIGMGIPNLIMRDERSGLGNGNSSENQVEMFNIMVSRYFDIVTTAIVDQVIRNLIEFNFDTETVPYANEPGYISEIPLRPTEIKEYVVAVKELTTLGYMNAKNQEDFNQVRAMLKLDQREVDQFANEASDVITKKIDKMKIASTERIATQTNEAKSMMNNAKLRSTEKMKKSEVKKAPVAVPPTTQTPLKK